MHKVRPDRPLDAAVVAVLRIVDAVTQELGVDSFVAGAMARDIMLSHVYGLPAGVATRDVDFAIATESWQHFERIKRALIATHGFATDPGRAHRLYYRQLPVDLVPFGGVEHAPAQIAWPPGMDIIMNVAGYPEALQTAERVQIEPDLTIRVASLPGLAVLKLFAWLDRGAADNKDARDLLMLLRRYSDAGNQDRLYGEAIEVLAAADYDLQLAGARLLGVDVARFATKDLVARVLAVLDDSAVVDMLTLHMARGSSAADHLIETQGSIEQLLIQFREGLRVT
jgi:predicted nucleotidyltransferase